MSTSEEELLSSSDEGEDNESDSSFLVKMMMNQKNLVLMMKMVDHLVQHIFKEIILKGAGGDDSDSDSDDEGRKVVKSAKDKLLDDMKSSIEIINSNKYNNNWSIVLGEFDKFGRF